MQHSNTAGCILLKFYIKPQHTANVYNLLYVVSYRNSTSNHNQIRGLRKEPVVVSYRNSTSNHNRIECTAKSAKVVSYRNSTSNHNSKVTATVNIPVVSYRNSTSNHNNGTDKIVAGQVVSYRNSTSNHNASTPQTRSLLLYLIEILHQTTTSHLLSTAFICCILSKFYIKPQLCGAPSFSVHSCILSKFYIKPQQRVRHKLGHSVVSYRNSTSNHNRPLLMFLLPLVVSYRNSTSNHNEIPGGMQELAVVSYRNSTSNHNSGGSPVAPGGVVSYRNSTSNHNMNARRQWRFQLYLIEILHQTTTRRLSGYSRWRCILSKFYIKPQRPALKVDLAQSCILSKFYIKPQHRNARGPLICCCILSKFYIKPQREALEDQSVLKLYLIEILHQTTTIEVIQIVPFVLYLIEILHQTTTMSYSGNTPSLLYLIEILHQTTTHTVVPSFSSSCILSKFYIKPQQCDVQ